MNARANLAGLSLSQLVGVAGFIIGCVTIWIHLEVRIAEINVDLTNLKQDILTHKSDNRRDFETLRSDISKSSEEILRKVDEIQIYLRDKE
ncbi:MAG: hypothetical protein WCK34_15430 [Bacteroidota bacterium]